MSARPMLSALSKRSLSSASTVSASAIASSSSSSPSSSATPASILGAKSKAKEAAQAELMETILERRSRKAMVSQFESLGSTQNRHTTWQPHHTLHHPVTPLALTQSHLVAAGAHLGHSPTLTHRSFIPLLYGTRSGISYIDMRQTLPHLRRAAEVVRGIVERDGIVVFVGSLKGAERAVWENAKRLGENGYGVTKWLPGTISNAKEVFGWCDIPSNNTSKQGGGGGGGNDEGNARRGAPLSPMSFKPSLLILLSPTLNRHALREATLNEVPTIGICDSDVDPRCVTYSIPANDDSPRAIELIAGVLGMAGKDGLERKKERLLREASGLNRRRVSELQARSRGPERR